MTANSLGLTVSEVQNLFRGSTQMREIDSVRIDEMRDGLAQILDRQQKQIDDHEARIRRMEQRLWQAVGAGSVVVMLVDKLWK